MTDSDLVTCPKCESTVPRDAAHCPNCGYAQPAAAPEDPAAFSRPPDRMAAAAREAAREAAGPFSFTFPAAENAYTFRPSGKASFKAVALMLSFGLGIALVGGLALYPLQVGVEALLAGLAKSSAFAALLAVVGAIILYPGLAALLGSLIGYGVGRGAVKGCCRRPGVIKGMATGASLVAYGLFLAVYIRVLGTATGFNSALDFFKLGANLVAIPLLGAMVSISAVRDKPFCERCEQYLEGRQLGRPGANRWPIRFERALMEALTSRQFERLADYPQDEDASNYTTVSYLYCATCRQTGYINAQTVQSRLVPNDKGGRTLQLAMQPIFSSALHGEEVDRLLALAEQMKQ